MDWITREHLGIVAVILGTVFLSFSVKVKRQYIRELSQTVDEIKSKSPDIIELTETYISRKLFWLGLFLVAIGSLLQW